MVIDLHLRLLRWSGLALGTLGMLWLGSSRAVAVDAIELRYNTQTFTISTDEMRRFAETGEIPTDLQQFFDDIDRPPGVVRTLLVEDIRLPRVIDEFLESPTGEFVLIQLDQVVSNVEQSEDVDSLRTAITTAGADRSISVIEVLEAYPADQVALDISDLEDVYLQVKTFVEQIEPAIATAIEFLQDVVCDCEEPVETEEMDESSAIPGTGTVFVASDGSPCLPTGLTSAANVDMNANVNAE